MRRGTWLLVWSWADGVIAILVAQRIPSWTLIGYARIFGGSPTFNVKGLSKTVG